MIRIRRLVQKHPKSGVTPPNLIQPQFYLTTGDSLTGNIKFGLFVINSRLLLYLGLPAVLKKGTALPLFRVGLLWLSRLYPRAIFVGTHLEGILFDWIIVPLHSISWLGCVRVTVVFDSLLSRRVIL